jgi:hypothetical protein
MRKYRWFVLGIALMLMGSVFGQAQSDDANARAQALLEQARETIGGSAKLKEIKTLSINGRVVRPGATSQEELKMNLILEAGDNMRFDMGIHRGEGVAGEHKDVDIIIRREHRVGEHEGQPGQPGQPEQHATRKKIMIRKIDGPLNVVSTDPTHQHRMMAVPPFDMINLMTAWLLKPTPHTVLSYAGEAENGTLDVLEIKREHGPTARLYLDKFNHVPVMLTYRDIESKAIFINKSKSGNSSKEEVEIIETLPGDLQVAEGEQVDVVLKFSDHRSVDGVLLPHQITRTVNGQLHSEWLIDKYELNGKIEMFERMPRENKK